MTVNRILQNGALARVRRWVGLVAVLALLTALAGGCDTVPEQERQILVLWHTLTGAEATALEVLDRPVQRRESMAPGPCHRISG